MPRGNGRGRRGNIRMGRMYSYDNYRWEHWQSYGDYPRAHASGFFHLLFNSLTRSGYEYSNPRKFHPRRYHKMGRKKW